MRLGIWGRIGVVLSVVWATAVVGRLAFELIQDPPTTYVAGEGRQLGSLPERFSGACVPPEDRGMPWEGYRRLDIPGCPPSKPHFEALFDLSRFMLILLAPIVALWVAGGSLFFAVRWIGEGRQQPRGPFTEHGLSVHAGTSGVPPSTPTVETSERESKGTISDRIADTAVPASPNLSSTSPSKSERRPHHQPTGEKSAQLLFALLRFSRGICGFLFVLQIVGLLPVLTWLQQPNAVPGSAFAQIMVKVVALLIFAWLFFGLRHLINRLHTRKYGSPHPSLVKKWAL